MAEYVLIYAAVVLTVISLVDYLVKNWNVMRDGAM
jgi:phosphatidylglycerophosphate synthase